MDTLMAEVEQRARLAFSNEMEMLTFYLTDGQLYGLNVFKIIEILECPKAVTKVPQSHPAIKGSIDFRGHPISMIDLSEALGLPPTDYRHAVSYVLVCEYSTSIQGFLVTQPNVLINKNWDDIIKPEGSVYDASYLTAITYHNDKPIQILDVEKILSEIVGIEVQVSEALLQKGRAVVTAAHHILAVDDSKAARNLIKSALDQLQIRHTLVEDAQRALEMLEDSVKDGGVSPYTIIFTDIEMPVMDGFTFTRKVRANPKLAGVYLAIHSSLSNKSNEEKAQQMGADDFIPKFTPDRIIGAIVEQLEKVEQRRNKR